MSAPELTAPRVAWPTIALLVAALATWLLGLAWARVAWPLGLAVCTVAAYVAFTPLHEATHRTIARARWVNEVFGRLASLPLLGPFPVVQFVHLEHHKHTNDPVADPDHWSGRGPGWLLPVRWLTQDIHYYVVFLRQGPRNRDRVEAQLTFAAVAAIAVARIALGHGREVACWFAAARLAIGVLAFAFDYLPHRPHLITAKQDRFAATSAFPGRVRYIASLGQSLHLVHHLYPGVPFYRYKRIWDTPARMRGTRAVRAVEQL
jgi:fatty acid desaturase